ncbi:MAG: response regulator transcription factor [Fimbriimonadaceae bacterium]|nr:response regulator transcription factor [Fimbriimonadaceae bacterium]QYK54799.1 MAG: response regulator transcription factor [Fimbriimonadaceae bacterium]
MRVLVVEDDEEIAEQLAIALRNSGHKPTVAKDGVEGEREALLNPYGVILLDVMMPGRNGFEVCRRLRQSGVETPILMLTAKDAVEDRVTGLDTGADDYLVKPFEIAELLARIRSLARRDSQTRTGVVTINDLVVDSRTQTATKAGEPLRLTPREFSLLEALVRNEGRTLTREAILERVWNNDEALPNTVSFHMSSLRKKVDPEAKLIHTVHGFGYVLRRGEG